MGKLVAGRLWFRMVCVALAGGAVWVLAVLVLPEDGWLRPGQVTALGLAVIVGLIVTFLFLEARESEDSDRDRAARRQKRRQRG